MMTAMEKLLRAGWKPLYKLSLVKRKFYAKYKIDSQKSKSLYLWQHFVE